MRPWTFRPLTEGERGLARMVFGAALACSRVRLLAVPALNRAFVAGAGLIVWPVRSARLDFAGADVPAAVQAQFVHELVHVWQAQHGTWLPWAKILAGDGEAAYAYDLDGSRRFAELNIEQQAMVVEHAFLTLRGGRPPSPARVYAAVLEKALPALATRLAQDA
ncbi:MAG: hypothetical protein J7521_19630 [Caulobacter sp.]|nr:hypothetical protein [Caulobacter sp.]